MQLVVDQVRDRALAAGAQAGEPDHAAFVAVEFLALSRVTLCSCQWTFVSLAMGTVAPLSNL